VLELYSRWTSSKPWAHFAFSSNLEKNSWRLQYLSKKLKCNGNIESSFYLSYCIWILMKIKKKSCKTKKIIKVCLRWTSSKPRAHFDFFSNVGKNSPRAQYFSKKIQIQWKYWKFSYCISILMKILKIHVKLKNNQSVLELC